MKETWEVGDQYRGGDYRGYYTGTIVQVLDGEYLVGRWRIIDGQRVASYLIVTEDRLRYATKKRQEAETGPKGTKTQWKALYAKAYEAGLQAGSEAKPVPMLVGTPKNKLASLLGEDDGGFDENEPVYFVGEGLCGFAWVTVRPGNSSFARWLVKNGKGSKGYYGGIEVWVREFGQSVARKEAFAQAFAEVLREAGIKAFSGSRLD